MVSSAPALAVQLRQHHRIPPIRLDAIAGLHRNQRGRHDHALMAKSCDLPMQPIAAWAGFVAEPYPLTASLAQALDKLADVIGAVQKIAEMAHLPTGAPSATAIEIVALWTSIPTKMVSCIRSVPHV